MCIMVPIIQCVGIYTLVYTLCLTYILHSDDIEIPCRTICVLFA